MDRAIDDAEGTTTTMPLTAAGIRALEPGPKDRLVADGQSLFLLVTTKGARHWRYRFRWNGRQQTLALGSFPAVSLAQAREARDEAKRMIAQGVNPALAKQERKRSAAPEPAAPAHPTLRQEAEAYVQKRQRDGASPTTIEKYLWAVDGLGDQLLDTPLDQVGGDELLERLRIYEALGQHDKIFRIRSLVSRLYKLRNAGRKPGDVLHDPAAGLSGHLARRAARHHPTILDRRGFGAFLRAVDGYAGDPSTVIALRLSPHVVLRSKEIRGLRWGDVDWEEDLIRIPGARMKVVGEPRDHIVPLSRQSRALLEEARRWSLDEGKPGWRDTLVLPSIRARGRPLSENTFNASFRRLGYTTDQIVHHGLRTNFSTWASESGLWERDWVETQLHHKEPNATRGAYNAAIYLAHRRPLMAWWSDQLDEMRTLPPPR